jgi:hypothetical protein
MSQTVVGAPTLPVVLSCTKQTRYWGTSNIALYYCASGIRTIHYGRAGGCFRETISLSDGNAQAEFHLIMSVRTERSASGKNEPHATAEYLFRGSEDIFIEERRSVAPFRPLQLVFVREIKNGLPERPRSFHLLVYSFRNAIKNKLQQTTISSRLLWRYLLRLSSKYSVDQINFPRTWEIKNFDEICWTKRKRNNMSTTTLMLIRRNHISSSLLIFLFERYLPVLQLNKSDVGQRRHPSTLS